MSAPAVQLTSVTFTYPGANAPALGDVSLSVEVGERLGILGPNGGGKSTLLKLILGLLTPSSGTVTVMGQPATAARRETTIGYVAQRSEAETNFPLSVRQVVELGLSWRLPPWRSPSRQQRAQIDSMIDLVGLSELSQRPIGALSGGQFQRAMIARALACGPKLLVLDEPTVGIDAVGQAQFAELLASIHRQLGLTLLIVSHDLRAIAAGCDRVACLAQRLHSHTSPEGLTPKVLAELFSHDLAGILGPGGMPGGGIHIHAHGPDEPCPVAEGVPLTIDRTARPATGRAEAATNFGSRPGPGGQR